MSGLLRYRNFRLLWLGQICSQFGDRLIQLILVAVAARASGSTLTLAKVLVFTSLPALVLNPLAGACVDRWDRKKTMIACDLIRAGAVLILPALAALPSRVPLYGDVFLLFAVASFFVPARLAMIPDMAPADELTRANALFTTSGMISAGVILVVGALLVEWAGVTRSCWVNAAGYLASAACIVPIARGGRPARAASEPASQPAGRILSEVWEGIRRLWSHQTTRRVVALLGILMAGAGAGVVAGTVLVQRSLGTVTKDLGFLGLGFGVGMFVGTVAYGRWGSRWSRPAVLGGSFLGCGITLWLFLLTVSGLRSRLAASAAAAALGICVAPAGILTNTLVHKMHPERLHGRIFSSLGVVVNGALILSMLGAGWFAERWGEPRLLMVLGGLFALGGSALLYYGKWVGKS